MGYFDQFEEVQESETGDYFAQFEEVAPVMGKAEAAWEGGKQGITFGFGDEASAAVVAGVTKTVDFFDDLYETDDEESMRLAQGEFYEPEKRESFSDIYTSSRDRFRADYAKAGEDQPGARLAGEIVGGVTTAVIPVGAAARTGKAIDTGIKATMAAGTKGGAAYGLGASEADLTEGEFAQAAVDTVEGAAFGAAGAGVLKGATKLPELAKEGKEYVSNKLTALKDNPIQAAKDLIPSGTGELIAQGIGHSLYPGGGFAAQSLLRKSKQALADRAERKAQQAVSDEAEAVIQKESLAKRAFKDNMAKKEADRASIYKADQAALAEAKRKAEAEALLPENVAIAEARSAKGESMLDMIRSRDAKANAVVNPVPPTPSANISSDDILKTIRSRKPENKLSALKMEIMQRKSTGVVDDIPEQILPTVKEYEKAKAYINRTDERHSAAAERAALSPPKDPYKQIQMKIISLSNQMSKTKDMGQHRRLQKDIDEWETVLQGDNVADAAADLGNMTTSKANDQAKYYTHENTINAYEAGANKTVQAVEKVKMPMGIKHIESLLDTDPSQLGIYADRLRTAKARGSEALIATDFILKQQHPEYNVLIKNLRK